LQKISNKLPQMTNCRRIKAMHKFNITTQDVSRTTMKLIKMLSEPDNSTNSRPIKATNMLSLLRVTVLKTVLELFGMVSQMPNSANHQQGKGTERFSANSYKNSTIKNQLSCQFWDETKSCANGKVRCCGPQCQDIEHQTLSTFQN
jgi:hypothetical protein